MPLPSSTRPLSHRVTRGWARANSRAELSAEWALTSASPARKTGLVPTVFLLCGLPTRLAAISARFSSSSLPPSFAPGRRTAAFIDTGTALRGARFYFDGAAA
jgi:hypothetical protein